MSAPSDSERAVEALTELLALHPGSRWLDALVVDLNGVVRGKRYPRADVEKLCRHGMQFPLSSYYLDATGECLDPLGLGVTDGDPDGTAWVLPDTFAPVPWTNPPGAQVIMSLVEADGSPSPFDARNLAAQQLAALEQLGFNAACAFELEFYLLPSDSAARPSAPSGHGQVYRLQEVSEYEPLLNAVHQACEAQAIPSSVITSEYAPGQFEINLRHVPDALRAADHAVMFKRLVSAIAPHHGMRATFMAKPFLGATGSGTHVHLSLLDADGANVFDETSADGEQRLQHAIAGLLDGIADAMLLYAPGVNSYRRFVANSFVPVNRSWGPNNRSVAVRIPHGPSDARRLEFRLPGADANPYLVLAAMLAGIRRGLLAAAPPPPIALGNACEELDPILPRRVEDAIERFAASPSLQQDFGERFVSVLAEAKRLEVAKFHDHISDREYDWYL